MSELPTPSLPNENKTPQAQTPALSTPHHKSKRLMFILGSALVGIGAIAGLGYASWAGYLPNPFMERPTAEALINALASIESAQTTMNIHMALENREENVEPLDLSLFQNEHADSAEAILDPFSFIQMLPSDLALTLSLNSSFSRANENANEETHITGNYTGNNISANLDITTRTVNGVTYIKPDAIPLPIPLFDMGALEGTWISFEEASENREVFSSMNDTSEEKTDEIEEETHAREELLTLIKESVANGALLFSVPERITYKDNRAWQTEAVIDGEKLREAVIALGENRATLFPNQTAFVIFTDEFIETTKKERAKDIYRELFKRMTLSAIMDNASAPLSLSFATRIAPKLEDDVLKDRQITLETTIEFSNINQPITITAPEDALTGEEALALMMGQTKESTLIDAQYSTVEDIRSALDMYRGEHGEYPESLNDLIGFEDGWREVIAIPEDIVTEKPYIYTRTETGYTLLYEMPAPEENESFSFRESTVEGTNTATERLLSLEGAKLDDEDEDGISLYDEVILYDTEDSMEDSDSDGYNDKEEIDAGYNPNGV